MAREVEPELKTSPIIHSILLNVVACVALFMGVILWDASLEPAERQAGEFGIYLMAGAGLVMVVDLVFALVFAARHRPLWARGCWYGLAVPALFGIMAAMLAFGAIG